MRNKKTTKKLKNIQKKLAKNGKRYYNANCKIFTNILT